MAFVLRVVIILIIVIDSNTINIGNVGFITVDVVTYAIDFHVVGEGGSCADEGKCQQKSA